MSLLAGFAINAGELIAARALMGATSPEQARGNAGAAGWQLTDEELNEVDSIMTSPG